MSHASALVFIPMAVKDVVIARISSSMPLCTAAVIQCLYFQVKTRLL